MHVDVRSRRDTCPACMLAAGGGKRAGNGNLLTAGGERSSRASGTLTAREG